MGSGFFDIDIRCPAGVIDETKEHGEAEDVVSVAVYLEKEKEITIFAINRNLEDVHQMEIDLRSFENVAL